MLASKARRAVDFIRQMISNDFDRKWRANYSYERIPGWFTFPDFYDRAVREAREGDVLVEVGACGSIGWRCS